MIKAKHIKSGHEGEIQQREHVLDPNGRTRVQFYFEDHARPTAAGWYYSHEIEIPGVNR